MCRVKQPEVKQTTLNFASFFFCEPGIVFNLKRGFATDIIAVRSERFKSF
jgi:hypothetical protein